MRVLTLNLHNPSPRAIAGIAAFLDGSGAEVLALTECQLHAAEDLARALDCAGMVHAPAPYWGNALLTRTLPLDWDAAVQLPRSSFGEPRSAAVADVDVEGLRVRLLATHLADLTEPDRLEQMRHLALHSDLDLAECVLMGDLNALTREDYDEERWEAIAWERQEAGLTRPTGELTGWLREELALEDAHSARPAGSPLSPTCPYGTRIDYVLVGPRCPLAPVPGTYKTLDAMAGDLTDHDAVVVDLAPR